MAIKYSDSMIEELKAIPRLDLASATVFAEKHGISSRSVIAKARSLEIDYHAKVPGTKAVSTRGPTKEELVKDLEKLLGTRVVSASKMTAVDLASLIASVKALG